jgi:DNA-binding PadR family transcriptional regulator
MGVIENRIFEYYKIHERNIKEAIKLLEENGYIVKEKNNDEQD